MAWESQKHFPVVRGDISPKGQTVPGWLGLSGGGGKRRGFGFGGKRSNPAKQAVNSVWTFLKAKTENLRVLLKPVFTRAGLTHDLIRIR